MNAIPNHIPVILVSLGTDGGTSECPAWANPDSGSVKTFAAALSPATERYITHEDESFRVLELETGELTLDHEDLGEFRSILNG